MGGWQRSEILTSSEALFKLKQMAQLCSGIFTGFYGLKKHKSRQLRSANSRVALSDFRVQEQLPFFFSFFFFKEWDLVNALRLAALPHFLQH